MLILLRTSNKSISKPRSQILKPNPGRQVRPECHSKALKRRRRGPLTRRPDVFASIANLIPIIPDVIAMAAKAVIKARRRAKVR